MEKWKKTSLEDFECIFNSMFVCGLYNAFEILFEEAKPKEYYNLNKEEKWSMKTSFILYMFDNINKDK